MALADYRIDTTEPGHPVVHVNGEEVPHVLQVAVNAPHGAIPTVLIEMDAGATISGRGIVRVDSGADPGSVVREWLNNLDPAALEQAILGASAGLGGPSTGELVLEVMKGWAGADADRT